MKPGPTLTLVAVAMTAFAMADVVHEGLGHGGACLALGGQMISLSTTYEACSIRGRAIDGAGPGAGLLVALAAWLWLRLRTPRSPHGRVFLCLLFAFTSFWNLGYLVESGLLDRGDWKYVIAGWEPAGFWRGALAVLGVVSYIGVIRLLGAILVRHFNSGPGQRAPAFALVALLAASLLALAGGALDPRGPAIIWTDALPAALSSLDWCWQRCP